MKKFETSLMIGKMWQANVRSVRGEHEIHRHRNLFVGLKV
jgi:hypothetical protein